VLLVKVCGCHPSIFGLILNRPAAHTMNDEFCPRSRAAYPRFVNNSVFVGGPVGPYWTVTSPQPTRGGFSIAPGLHVVGSLSQTQAAVMAGELAPSDVRFYSGYAAWPIERLKQEVAAGKWRVAQASKEFLAAGLAGGNLRASLQAQLR